MFMTLKTVFLVAITSLKRVEDLHALTVSPWTFLHPKPGYVLKVPTNAPWPIILQAFCPSPFKEQDLEKFNLICLVRTLDNYVHKAAKV